MQENQLLSDISVLFVQSKWLVSSIWVNLKKVSPGNSSLISYKKKRMNNHSLFCARKRTRQYAIRHFYITLTYCQYLCK